MDFESRACRVCMKIEGKEKFIDIFEGNAKTALEIFLIAGVEIIDCTDTPSLICNNCTKDLSNAIKFRNQCRSTNYSLRSKLLLFETTKWTTELQFLTNLSVKPEEVVVQIKTEPNDAQVDVQAQDDDEDICHLNDFDDWLALEEVQEEPKKEEKSKTIENAVTCDKCGYVAKNKKKLKYHRLIKHFRNSNYECHVCKVTLLVKSSLKRHLLNKHGIQDFEFKEDGCPYCMEMYDNLTVLKEHIRKEHENDEREYFCDMCGRSYGNKIKLMNHVRLVHVFHPKRKVLEAQEDFKLIRKKNEMPCPTCGKIFKDSKSLKSHENTHKIWRPEDYFYCDLCGNKFKEINPLRTHIKFRHIKNVRYVCESCPDKSWSTNAQLKRHIKVFHQNIKEFKCEWCGKEFGVKVKLINHTRIHTGEKPFQCNICGSSYTHETDYRRHVSAHAGEKRKYRCQICSQIFYVKSQLKKHKLECSYHMS